MIICLLWNGYLHSFNVDFNDDVHRFFFRIKNLYTLTRIWYWPQLAFIQFDSDVHFVLFRPEIFFPDNISTFSTSDQKYDFWENSFQKTNFRIKLKFGTYTNLNVLDSILMFTFSALDWKQTFWTNVMAKIKIACLCWNFVLTLLLIRWFWWWCSGPKVPNCASIVEKIKLVCLN